MDAHILSIYQAFFERLSHDSLLSQYQDDEFLIYHIGSPCPTTLPNIRDELSVKVYFRSLNNPIILSQEYALDSVPFIHIGHIALRDKNFDGASSIFYKEVNNIKKAGIKDFSVDPQKDFLGFITIDEAMEEYAAYSTLRDSDCIGMGKSINDLESEHLAVYNADGQILLIPCSVILQAFYIKCTENSLSDAMRHPTGIASMVVTWRETYDDDCRHGYIELSGNSHIGDVDMLIYFAQDPDLTKMFNRIASTIWSGRPIMADIPKKGEINIVAECFYGKAYTLVTNILASDLIDDVVRTFCGVEVLHRKSYTWTGKGQLLPPKQNNRMDSSSNDKLDDFGKADRREKPLPVLPVGKQLESIGSSKFRKQILSAGERERSFKSGPPSSRENPVSPTTRSPRGGRGSRKPVQTVNIDREKNETVLSENVKIEESLAENGYRCTVVSNPVPIPPEKNIPPLFCFCDRDKTILRKYYVLMAESSREECKPFYFIWLDPQLIDGTARRKEMLLVLTVDISMEEMVRIIDRELEDQAENGNRKWFRGKDTGFAYKTLRHSERFAEDPASATIRMLDKFQKQY